MNTTSHAAGNGAGAASTTGNVVAPRFVTILAARSSNARPSDLEVHLRAHCQKLIVRERLTGAHFVFPGEPSLAVRVYYPINIQSQEKASSKVDNIATRQALKLRAVHEPSGANNSGDDIDGIRTFCKSFKFSLILFILPRDSLEEQLERMDSFTNRVMHLVEESCSTVKPKSSW